MQFSWTFLTLAVILLVLQQTSAESCSKPTKKCKKKDGICISKDEACSGEVKKGKKWCKDGENCKCCIGGEQGCQEQPACSVIGGSCMNKDEECNGQEVISDLFCSGPSCKCCVTQETCPSCDEKEDTECSGDVFGLTYEGICRNNCDDDELRFGDCGPNCGCCVSIDLPEESCEDELEQPCGGSFFGFPYGGTCRAKCNEDEVWGGPCGNSNEIGRTGPMARFMKAVSRTYDENDEECGCCIKLDIPTQETCPNCEEKEDTECSGDVFGLTYEGICRNNCDEDELRFGDCGPNCGCCVSIDLPEESCEDELEQPCGGSFFGFPYGGTCRANCNEDEVWGGPCGNSNEIGRTGPMARFMQAVSRTYDENDEECGCCIKLDIPTIG